MVLVVLLAAGAVAADWPQWLGPTRDGRSAETGLTTAWQTTAPRELWRTSPGRGYSSIAVAGGVAYTMADDAAGAWVIAMDAATGAQRWRSRVDDPYIDPMGFSGPRSTPSIVGDRLTTVTGRGLLVALSTADGHLLWSVDLVGGLGAERPTWGFSGSPLVSDGKVYASVGAKDDHGIAAFSLSDGRMLWSRGAWHAGYSSPIRTTLAGRDQVVFFTGNGPVAVTPDKGELLWEFPWKTNYEVNAATPLILPGDRVFIASGYGTGGTVLQVGNGAPTPVWASKGTRNKTATSVLHDGSLYGFDEDRLVSVNATTGETTWSTAGYGRGTLIAADGHLFVLGENCKLSLIQATPAAYTRVAGPLDVLAEQPCWSTPALADGVLYLRDGKQMVALSLR